MSLADTGLRSAVRPADDDSSDQAASPEPTVDDDELSRQINRAKADKAFQTRLQASMEEHKELLDLLAEH